jgi:hypothetical protein
MSTPPWREQSRDRRSDVAGRRAEEQPFQGFEKVTTETGIFFPEAA